MVEEKELSENDEEAESEYDVVDGIEEASEEEKEGFKITKEIGKERVVQASGDVEEEEGEEEPS